MNHSEKSRRYVVTHLTWLIEEPTKNATAGLTAYRAELGIDDLFSIFAMFLQPSATTGKWERAKIYALVEEMEDRLPPIGKRLVIAAGARPLAYADVVAEDG